MFKNSTNPFFITRLVLSVLDRKFKQAKPRYVTSAERQGWSWVLKPFLSPAALEQGKNVPEGTWWVSVKGAAWNKVNLSPLIEQAKQEILLNYVIHVHV